MKSLQPCYGTGWELPAIRVREVRNATSKERYVCARAQLVSAQCLGQRSVHSTRFTSEETASHDVPYRFVIEMTSLQA